MKPVKWVTRLGDVRLPTCFPGLRNSLPRRNVGKRRTDNSERCYFYEMHAKRFSITSVDGLSSTLQIGGAVFAVFDRCFGPCGRPRCRFNVLGTSIHVHVYTVSRSLLSAALRGTKPSVGHSVSIDDESSLIRAGR